jgi:hypothetical protein
MYYIHVCHVIKKKLFVTNLHQFKDNEYLSNILWMEM